MAALVLETFIFLEVVAIAASLVWISRTTDSDIVRAVLSTIAATLVIVTILWRLRIEGDPGGLYGIALIPFSLFVLLPAAGIAFAGAAWYWSRKHLQRLQEHERPGQRS